MHFVDEHMRKKCLVNLMHPMVIVIVAICGVVNFQLLLMLLLVVFMIFVLVIMQNERFNDTSGNYLPHVNPFLWQNVFHLTKNACWLVAAVHVIVKERSCMITVDDLMPLKRKPVDIRR